MSRRMIIMLILAGVLFGGVFGMKWFSGKMMNDFLNAMPTPPATISTTTAQTMVWRKRLQAVGTLRAVNGAELTAESDGVVTAIHFDSGDNVEEGALLLELESAAERGELRRLEAQAELAELGRQRTEQLFKRGSASKAELDTVLAQTKEAKAAVEAQRGRLALKQLQAPFSGKLGLRRVNVGQYLALGEAVVTLQALDPIDVDFSLPEKELGQVEPGLEVTLTLDAGHDQQYKGELVAVEPRVDVGTRNFDLRARLQNPQGKLKPGQFAEVRLALPGQTEYVVVPRSAIQYASFGNSVFVVQKNPDAPPPPEEADPNMPPHTDLMVSQRFVTLGEARGDYIAVLDGLEAGEEVAAAGLLKLRSKQPVIINNESHVEPSLNPKPEEG